MASTVSQLKSTLDAVARAVAGSAGAAHYFPSLFRSAASDGGATIDLTTFQSILRRKGKVSSRLVSDDNLVTVFNSIDSDRDGLVDIDQVVMWFATSRTQRVGLPSINTHKMARAEDDPVALQSKLDVERAASSRYQEENPAALTTFYYKQRAAYDRSVNEGKELRLLLPYNINLDSLKDRYEDVIDELIESDVPSSPTRGGGSNPSALRLLTRLLDACGFNPGEQRLRNILNRFRVDPDERDLDALSMESPKIKTFFDHALIDSSAGGWEYKYHPMPVIEPEKEEETVLQYEAPDESPPRKKDQPEKEPKAKKATGSVVLPKIVRAGSTATRRPGHPKYSNFSTTQRKWNRDVQEGKLRKGTGSAWYAYVVGDFPKNNTTNSNNKLPPVNKPSRRKRNLRYTTPHPGRRSLLRSNQQDRNTTSAK